MNYGAVNNYVFKFANYILFLKGEICLEQGYLLVQAFGSRESFGEKGVKVTVGGAETLFTDENGFTKTITLSAPNQALSESPGNPSPYTMVDITAEKEGFYTIVIKNVQIFSGEITQQQVQMLPVPENGEVRTVVYVLTPQNL